MKLFCAPIVCLLLAALLGGCSKTESENDLALQLRSDFLAMDGCSGTMDVTADYGQRVYEYTVSFSSTQKSGMTLVITAPEEVAGITATVENGQTFLKFGGVQLETGPLNADGLSPLDALPAFIAAMQSGYIAETGSEMLGETETLRLCCREPESPQERGWRPCYGLIKHRKPFYGENSAAMEPQWFDVSFLPL